MLICLEGVLHSLYTLVCIYRKITTYQHGSQRNSKITSYLWAGMGHRPVTPEVRRGRQRNWNVEICLGSIQVSGSAWVTKSLLVIKTKRDKISHLSTSYMQWQLCKLLDFLFSFVLQTEPRDLWKLGHLTILSSPLQCSTLHSKNFSINGKGTHLLSQSLLKQYVQN